ncbi:hypothetical protein CLV62_104175 [Dysgonomonas alginatilytica]|uniref:Uncharacterized protein n=1 Tax=Dysgonomonas alginatilytica TaxID=1605892 RepID=A0A2V3PR92_9BACT|nr:hypothetical protein CLV62_104175 [Dysgonomonas alginatilytica]
MGQKKGVLNSISTPEGVSVYKVDWLWCYVL